MPLHNLLACRSNIINITDKYIIGVRFCPKQLSASKGKGPLNYLQLNWLCCEQSNSITMRLDVKSESSNTINNGPTKCAFNSRTFGIDFQLCKCFS